MLLLATFCFLTQLVTIKLFSWFHNSGVEQSYELQVYDDFVMRGNTGVLRCHVPSQVREYVQFAHWLRSDGMLLALDSSNGNLNKGFFKWQISLILNILFSFAGEGRYAVFTSGELHVFQVDPLLDSQFHYRCVAKNRLTGEQRTSSNSAKLIITGNYAFIKKFLLSIPCDNRLHCSDCKNLIVLD